MLFNLLGGSNAGISGNKALSEFLRVQTGNNLINVDGKWQPYSPPYKFYSDDLTQREAEAIKHVKAIGVEAASMFAKDDLEVYTAWVARHGREPRLIDPNPRWAPDETSLRHFGANETNTAVPHSSSLERIVYDAKNQIVHYKFRSGNKAYHSLMDRGAFNKWITAPSIGKYFNKYLRTPGVGPLNRIIGANERTVGAWGKLKKMGGVSTHKDGTRVISSFVTPAYSAPTNGL